MGLGPSSHQSVLDSRVSGPTEAYLMQLVRAPTEHEQHLRERRRKLLRHAVARWKLGDRGIQGLSG